MISISLTSVKWGVDTIEDGAAQINLLDEQSGIIIHVPFQRESIVQMIGFLSNQLSDEDRRKLLPRFSGGVVVPNAVDADAIRTEKR